MTFQFKPLVTSFDVVVVLVYITNRGGVLSLPKSHLRKKKSGRERFRLAMDCLVSILTEVIRNQYTSKLIEEPAQNPLRKQTCYLLNPWTQVCASLKLLGKFSTCVVNIIKNKQRNRNVLLSSFHMNGHTLGFHPQTQKVEPPCTV